MPSFIITPEGYFKNKGHRNLYYPVNPHRFYKKAFGDDEDYPQPPPPPEPDTDCGYTTENNTDGSVCYIREFILTECVVRVRICVMEDGTMKTTHEVRSTMPGFQRHGIRILNDLDGNTDCRSRTKEFMLYSTAPETGTYKTHSRLYPSKNYLSQSEVDDKFKTKTELIAGAMGAGSFATAVYWLWRAVLFFRDKRITAKKEIQFRCVDVIRNEQLNRVTLEREGLNYNLKFDLFQGGPGKRA